MFDILHKDLPEFDYHRFQRWLATITSAEDMLHPPTCMAAIPAEVKGRPVVVDDEVLPRTAVVRYLSVLDMPPPEPAVDEPKRPSAAMIRYVRSKGFSGYLPVPPGGHGTGD
jgi:hypothetical protein